MIGDADHAPVLAIIPLTCVNFLKPGLDPIPLPREPKVKTPLPEEDLKEFKDSHGQKTGTSTANLIHELDNTLEPAYTVKESVSQDETVKNGTDMCGHWDQYC